MNIIYTQFIKLYGFAVKLAATFNPKAKLWVDGRRDWQSKMSDAIFPKDRIIWVHCSSLGEFEQGRPVMEKIRENYPNHKLAVSFFSPSGYEVRKDYQGADYIFYLPLDTPKNAKDLIRILNPEILILVKYEYWYNLLSELSKQNIKVIVISAVIKESSLFFKSWASEFREIISKIDHFFVQDIDSKNLLNAININAVTIAGDTRFDRVKEIRESHQALDFVNDFKGNSKLIVVGSSWPDDEKILVEFINEHLPDDWKVIFAPHNIIDKQIQNLANGLEKKVSILSKSKADEINTSQILIVDKIGVLTQIYAYSDLSYVGGGFTKTGVHNTLEPAVFGVPIIFGPNYSNYFEAIDLVDISAAISYSNKADFFEIMLQLLKDEKERDFCGKAAYEYIQSKPNATKLVLKYLKEKIKQ